MYKEAHSPYIYYAKLHLMSRLFILFLFFGMCKLSIAQMVFADLQGTTVNTTGWNLTGAAYVGNTAGDADVNNNEVILTNNSNGSSGGIFFTEPLDLSTCNQWHVDFDFRIWEGNGADGLAFCFLDVPPTGFVSGGGVGIPSTANGIKVVLDTYNNWGGANPGLQIYSGSGYNENPAISPGIVFLDNIGGNLNFIRSNTYNTATITYNNGTLTLTINGTLYLTTFFPVNFAGYMGFTASTGGLNDKHSIKNVSIFADLPQANAGGDISVCSGESIQIGGANNPNNTYSWLAEDFLDDPEISNPTATIVNNTPNPIVQQYVVETLIAANSGACPDYDTVNVTVLPSENTSENIVICETAIPYQWNGIDFNTTTSHTLNLLNVNNCDSTATLNLTVNLSSNSMTDTTLCETQVPFTWNGVAIDSAGDFLVTLVNSSGCDSLTNLNVTINPILTSTTDTTVCDTEIPFNWNGLTFNSTSIQTITLSSMVTGCDSLASLNVWVLPTLTSETDTTVCETELPFNWNGLTFNSQGQQTATLQSLDTGCDSLASLNVIVNPTLISTTSVTLCDHEIPFNWNNLELNASGSSTVILQSTVTGCDSIVNLELIVNPTLLSISDTTVCSSELPFNWNGLTFDAAGAQTAALQSLITGCDSLASLNCTVIPIPEIAIDLSATGGCVPIEITISNPFATENSLCEWEISDGTSVSSCSNNLTFTAAGCYDIELTSTEMGCTSSILETNIICLDAKPVASFTATPALIMLSTQWVQFYNTSSFSATNFQWDFGDNEFSIDENPQHEYVNNSAGYLANLIASTNQGCADTASLFIVCKEEPIIFIPNTFTPDGDHFNQSFTPVISTSIDPYNYTLWIYNRWGEVVFESHQPDIGWDGTYGTEGLDAKEDTYIWKIVYKLPDTDLRKTISGHVNLIR